MIATNTPDIMVLTEANLQKGNKPQPWLHQLLTNYKWWTSINTNGGTIVCVRKCIALATSCSLVHSDPEGGHTSVILNIVDANLLIIGTYWPSRSAPEAQASRFEMQAQITTIINENENCTPLIIGDVNATTSAHDRTSTNKCTKTSLRTTTYPHCPTTCLLTQTHLNQDPGPSHGPRERTV
jgi:exonuclease III